MKVPQSIPRVKLTTLLTVILLISLIPVACTNNDTTAVPGKSNHSPLELKQIFLPIMNGVWIGTGYINKIEKTKSPLKSSDLLAHITTLIISDTAAEDSVRVGSSLGNHEGYDFMLFFKPGQTDSSLKTNIPDYDNESNFYELGYDIRNEDTSLFLYHYTSSNKLLGTTKFSKVLSHSPENNPGYGLQYKVNKCLFAGSYTFSDSLSKPRTVQFKSDGTVIDFASFANYFIITDFDAEPENTTDQICFDSQTNHQQCYAFEVKGNTILLYEIVENREEDAMRPGGLAYKLIKQ